MVNNAPIDWQERKQIENDLDINILVEAGAGSGKTASLIKRMLSIVKSGKCEVSEIAAITFTRKAAAELKERFQIKLEESFREAKDEIEKQRLQRAILNLDKNFIGTIHSFCGQLLRERPVEGGLNPDFKELDEIEKRIYLERAWEAHLIDIKVHNPSMLETLYSLGIDFKELKANFIILTNYQDVKFSYESRPKPDIDAPLKAVKDLVYEALKHIPVNPNPDYDKLQEKIRRSLRQFNYFDSNTDYNKIKIISQFEGDPNVTQNRWTSKDAAKYYKEKFTQLSENIIKPVMREWREYCYYPIMTFLIPATYKYQEIKQRESSLDFQDLLTRTANMLREYPEVRDYFQRKYKALLIDEFQDTDPIQSEIMMYLTGDDNKEKSWSKLSPRQGSLFVVGDPKQSIYRFRRADIYTYNQVKKIITEGGGKVVTLTTNFRSQNSIGKFANKVFEELLADAENPYQALYSPLNTVRDDLKGYDSGIRVLEVDESCSKKEEIVIEDAKRIAALIYQGLNGGLKLLRTEEEIQTGRRETPEPRDFLIILRYKDMIDIYARALEGYGIPVVISGGSSLKETTELQELLTLLKAIEDIDNKINLVSVLRGLFFGISDDGLYQFKEAGGAFNIFTDIPKMKDKAMEDQFNNAYQKLKGYYKLTRENPIVAAIEDIIEDLGIIPYTLIEPLGKSKCSYVHQVLEILRKAEVNGATKLSQIIVALETLMESNLEDEIDIDGSSNNAVRLMNLHRAKGLEAAVVFLAHPCKSVSFVPELHIKRSGAEPEGFMVFKNKDKTFGKALGQPVNWDEYCHEEGLFQDAEEDRLLYVAVTRARNLLIISKSGNERQQSKNPWGKLLDKATDQEFIHDSPIHAATTIDEDDAPITLTIKDVLEVNKAIRNWSSNLKEATYHITSPTALKEELNIGKIIRTQTGKGPLWGNVIHKGIESLINDTNNLDNEIQNALKDNGLPLELTSEAKEEITKFTQAPLWQRIVSSKDKLTEVPFSLNVPTAHPLQQYVNKGSALNTLLSGVIDLAFKEDKEWVIVDFKSDRVEDEDSLKNLIELYRKQVEIYIKVWEEITGDKVKEGLIYYSMTGKSYKI